MVICRIHSQQIRVVMAKLITVNRFEYYVRIQRKSTSSLSKLKQDAKILRQDSSKSVRFRI